jgi:hypothetical protein
MVFLVYLEGYGVCFLRIRYSYVLHNHYIHYNHNSEYGVLL